MSDDVAVKFSAEIAGLTQSIEGLKGQLEGLREYGDKVGEGFNRIGELIGIKFSVEAIKAFIESMSELGERTLRTSEILGISTEEVGFLNYAAESTGTQMDALTGSLERLALGLAQAQGKSTPTAKAIEAMGLSSRELIQLPLPQLLDKLREGFERVPEGLERTRVAMALTKGGAENLLPVLGMTGQQWEELKRRFDATGAAMSLDMARAFDETNNRIGTMKTAVTGLGMTIFSAFEPAIDASVDGITSFVEGINDLVKRDPVLQAFLQAFVFAVDAVIAAVMTLVEAFVILWETASGIIVALDKGLIGVAHAVVDVLSGNFSAIPGRFADFTNSIDTSVDRVGQSLSRYSSLLKELFGIGSKPPPLVGVVQKGGPSGLGDLFGGEKSGAAWEKTIEQTQRSIAALKAQGDSFGMSTRAAATFEEQQKLTAIAMQTFGSVSAKTKVQIDQLANEYGIATERLELLREKQQAFGFIADGISNAITDWLKGTATLGQAFLQLAAQIAVAVVQALIFDAIMKALGLPMGGGGGPLGAIVGSMVFGGGRASGGPIESGKWYIAGEHGPEPVWGGGAGAFATGYGGGMGGFQMGDVHIHPGRNDFSPLRLADLFVQAVRLGHPGLLNLLRRGY